MRTSLIYNLFLLIFIASSCGKIKQSIIGCDLSRDETTCVSEHNDIQAQECQNDETLNIALDGIKEKAENLFDSISIKEGHSYTVTQGSNTTKVYLVAKDSNTKDLYYYLQKQDTMDKYGPEDSRVEPFSTNRVVKYTLSDVDLIIENVKRQVCTPSPTTEFIFDNSNNGSSSIFQYQLKSKTVIEDASDILDTLDVSIDPIYPLFFQMLNVSFTSKKVDDDEAEVSSITDVSYSYSPDKDDNGNFILTSFTGSNTEQVDLRNDINNSVGCELSADQGDPEFNMSFQFPVDGVCGSPFDLTEINTDLE